MVGPTALGNPVAWLPAALITLTADTPNGVRVLILGLGLVSVLVPKLDARRAGLAAPRSRFTALTAMWMVALLLLWTILTGLAQGSPAVADAKPDVQPPSSVLVPVDVGPGDVAPDVEAVPVAPGAAAPARPQVIQGLPVYELSQVDVQPELMNRDVVSEGLSRHYPALLRDAGVTGTVTIAFTLDTLGVPVPRSFRVESTTHDAFSTAAVSVAMLMRFRPAEKDGRVVPARVTLPVTFALQ
jgi:TonB family protein